MLTLFAARDECARGPAWVQEIHAHLPHWIMKGTKGCACIKFNTRISSVMRVGKIQFIGPPGKRAVASVHQTGLCPARQFPVFARSWMAVACSRSMERISARSCGSASSRIDSTLKNPFLTSAWRHGQVDGRASPPCMLAAWVTLFSSTRGRARRPSRC